MFSLLRSTILAPKGLSAFCRLPNLTQLAFYSSGSKDVDGVAQNTIPGLTRSEFVNLSTKTVLCFFGHPKCQFRTDVSQVLFREFTKTDESGTIITDSDFLELTKNSDFANNVIAKSHSGVDDIVYVSSDIAKLSEEEQEHTMRTCLLAVLIDPPAIEHIKNDKMKLYMSYLIKKINEEILVRKHDSFSIKTGFDTNICGNSNDCNSSNSNTRSRVEYSETETELDTESDTELELESDTELETETKNRQEKSYAKYRYFNPNIAKKYASRVCDASTVEVTCYDRGIFWVCPNPIDKKLVQDMEDQYDQGYFVNKISYYVPEFVLKDPTSWNS